MANLIQIKETSDDKSGALGGCCAPLVKVQTWLLALLLLQERLRSTTLAVQGCWSCSFTLRLGAACLSLF